MKQKTHKGTAKRTKVTGTGKVLFRKSAGNHLLSSKNPRQVKLAGGDVAAPKGHMQKLSRLLNISKKSGKATCEPATQKKETISEASTNSLAA